MKIDSCLILKNEEKNIEKLINQLLEFSNEIHLTDTGSTDNTVNIIKEIQKKHSNVFLHYFEWCKDFAKARNYSLYCYECKADYQFWCDGDDQLNDKLIETLKTFDGQDDLYTLNYLYTKTFLQKRNSLIKVAAKIKWVDPIHEFLYITQENSNNFTYFDNGSLIIHQREQEENSNSKQDGLSRNLDIFMNMEKENYKFSVRNRFHYGRDLYREGLKESALNQFQKCIDDRYSDIKWYTNVINSCIFMFSINGDTALQYFYKIFSDEIFIRKDLYYVVGDYFFDKQNYKLAKFYYLLCINCDEPNNYELFYYDRECHLKALLQLGAIEYNYNNNKKLAIKYNKEVLKIDKKNETAIHNLKILNKKK